MSSPSEQASDDVILNDTRYDARCGRRGALKGFQFSEVSDEPDEIVTPVVTESTELSEETVPVIEEPETPQDGENRCD